MGSGPPRTQVARLSLDLFDVAQLKVVGHPIPVEQGLGPRFQVGLLGGGLEGAQGGFGLAQPLLQPGPLSLGVRRPQYPVNDSIHLHLLEPVEQQRQSIDPLRSRLETAHRSSPSTRVTESIPTARIIHNPGLKMTER